MPETRIVKPSQAIPVAVGTDGLLRIGAGHIRLDPADPDFAATVIAALGQLARTPEGAEILHRGGTAGHPVTIEKPFAPTDPPNAWVIPEDLGAATAAGTPTGARDADGRPVLGTGTGCGSTIVFNPAEWTARGAREAPSSEGVLQLMLKEATMNATGSSAGSGGDPAIADGEGTAGLRLSCRPGRSGNQLIFPYALRNEGSAEVYVMDAIPSLDPDTRTLRATDQAAVVILGPEGDAVLGRFAAPPPRDRRMALPVMPLACRLPPGGTLERQLTVPLPLAETSPYFADLPLRRYEIVEIKGIVLTIGYWLAGVDHLAAAPVEDRPDLFAVTTRNTAKSARRIAQRFPTTGLQLFKRTDAFPRTLG